MFKPGKARYNPRWEELRQQFRRILRRSLTPEEERLLELSQALLEEEKTKAPDANDEVPAEQQAQDRAALPLALSRR